MSSKSQIQTALNVLIDVPIAGLDKRILAFIIDSLIQGGYFILIFFAINMVSFNSDNPYGMVIILILAVVPVLLYHFLFESLNNGQSPGKRAMNIQVVSEDGNPPTLLQYFLRWILRIADFAVFSGLVALVVAASTPKRQRVGDLVAGTIVIDLKIKSANKNVGLRIEEGLNYQPYYSKASELTQNEILIIQEVLNMPYSPDRESIINELGETLEVKYGFKLNGTYKRMLITLLKDFKYYEKLEDEDLFEDNDLV